MKNQTVKGKYKGKQSTHKLTQWKTQWLIWNDSKQEGLINITFCTK